jgi:prepilin-type N-terminal cleavage/methylation domain-containing protein
MRLDKATRFFGVRGFSFAEMMIAASLLGVIMAAVYTSTNSLLGSMKASENYSVGQLMAMDYISLDLRRATSYSFTGTTPLTLPLNLTLPTFYESNGKTPKVPQRVLVTSANTKDKKKHKVFSARYYYTYGTLGATVAVQYYLTNGTLYRQEGSLPARAIGSNIASVTFGPDATSIAADPVVTTTITFTQSLRAKVAPPPLSSTTFMRQYYYSDYN